jgi:threonine synthase
MTGLAGDGGLLLPRAIPRIDRNTLNSWQGFSYQELAFEIMSRFIDDIPGADLRALIAKSYDTFSDPRVTPITHLGDLHVLELFHGPTLAFKDIALQFLGNLFEYLLDSDSSCMNIIGATSGDTGSAAIYGVRGKKGINIFILHPHGRISPVQEKQMTGVIDANVFNIGVKGTFDDAQAIVKSIFEDTAFKSRLRLGAVNSINWARVLAQVVYYIYGYLHIFSHEDNRAATFSVPTGNFGDIFAGFIARRMLPEGSIGPLILATNENDILARFVNDGDYSRATVISTSSPSMDIQAASNFERYLFYLFDQDSERVTDAMHQFKADGRLDLASQLGHIRRDFVASSVSQEQVRATIAETYEQHGYLLDPHTAVGVRAAGQHQVQGIPVICLATAHPAKFNTTVEQAIGQAMELPPALSDIMQQESHCEIMEADQDTLMAYLVKHAIEH